MSEAPAAGLDRVPVVDLAPLIGGTRAGVEQVASEISTACEAIGFFYVVNHGVAQPVIDAVLRSAWRFFALPETERGKVAINKWHRGFMKHGEITVPGYDPDLKETFELGIHLPLDHPDVVGDKPLHGPNQWPDALPGFREDVERYFNAAVTLGRQLLRAIAVALDEPADFFEPMFEQPLASMRLLHYPPQRVFSDTQHGTAPHTDYGALTVLLQDETGGLEVRTRDGNWIAAPCLPGSFVINIGDMMACWTNDRFTSTPHRVVNRAGRERFSVPVFLLPSFDSVVRCFDSCQSPAQPPKYAPIKSGEYLLGKFNKTYAYRKAELAQGAP